MTLGSTKFAAMASFLLGFLAGTAPVFAKDTKEAPLIEEGAQVDFGMIAPSAQAGTIAITNSGSQLCSPTLQCLGGQHLGLIYVTGRKDELVTILIGNALLSNGNAIMRARFSPSQPYLILRPGRRKNEFSVSGNLTVEPNQRAGRYVGTYDIIVEYQ